MWPLGSIAEQVRVMHVAVCPQATATGRGVRLSGTGAPDSGDAVRPSAPRPRKQM